MVFRSLWFLPQYLAVFDGFMAGSSSTHLVEEPDADDVRGNTGHSVVYRLLETPDASLLLVLVLVSGTKSSHDITRSNMLHSSCLAPEALAFEILIDEALRKLRSHTGRFRVHYPSSLRYPRSELLEIFMIAMHLPDIADLTPPILPRLCLCPRFKYHFSSCAFLILSFIQIV